MACLYPVVAYRSRIVNPSGKRSLVFNRKAGFEDLSQPVACGKCAGCKADRARVWAIRCYHEASQYDVSSFLTLTYDDAHLPADGLLDKSHLQLF